MNDTTSEAAQQHFFALIKDAVGPDYVVDVADAPELRAWFRVHGAFIATWPLGDPDVREALLAWLVAEGRFCHPPAAALAAYARMERHAGV